MATLKSSNTAKVFLRKWVLLCDTNTGNILIIKDILENEKKGNNIVRHYDKNGLIYKGRIEKLVKLRYCATLVFGWVSLAG